MIKYIIFILDEGRYLCPIGTYDKTNPYWAIKYDTEQEAWDNTNSYCTVYKIMIRE